MNLPIGPLLGAFMVVVVVLLFYIIFIHDPRQRNVQPNPAGFVMWIVISIVLCVFALLGILLALGLG